MTNKLIAASTLALGLASASPALAQPPPESSTFFSEKVAAPRDAVELTFGTGYTQGFGKLRSGVDMRDVATSGVAFDLSAGYRFTPNWSLGATGQFFELSSERAAGARGVVAGVAATYHLAPYVRSDPWVQLGTGYRVLWEEHDAPLTNTVTYGFQLARVAVGFDLRANEDLAISPVVGVDLNSFLWQSQAGSNNISDPSLNAFVFGGVQGRFDFNAMHESRDKSAVARR